MNKNYIALSSNAAAIGATLGQPTVCVGKPGELKYYNTGPMAGTRISSGDIYAVQDMRQFVRGRQINRVTLYRPARQGDL